ncbi:flagellar associated protein [Raphidocelis subcapitata]|uniref:Flagellar associated protein n=1 Tax=Raphidocelis subcapitata TaxID=307507 RepID=A0A2V0NUC0_9CHLO|nr:flagellar associated protein [Raphidocelis subcapitata]|eukprot:GBF89160.1 flagellar associated protein [Raphidocelis subcapitata]
MAAPLQPQLAQPDSRAPLAKTVANERNQQQLNLIANNIGGTADQLKRHLAKVDAELKADLKGRKEFEDYLTKLKIQRADLAARIDRNKAWIAKFERNSDNGAFEEQYKRLLDEIQSIYEGAKEFHQKGIELLIRDFRYHVAYKRWNDNFSAVPFKPK